MAHDHAFHGWALRAPMRLPSFAEVDDSAAQPISLRWSPDPAPELSDAAGECLASEDRPDGSLFYRIVAGDGQYTVHMPQLFDFVISADFRRIDMWRAGDAEDAIVDVILGGILSASLIMLNGDLALHASAVLVADQAVAFVGQRGMGKSTLATIMCRDGGAQLISDDVLRVLPGPSRIFPGATATRLRAAWQDSDGQEPTHRETADARYALALDSVGSLSPIPLAAVVVPFPSRDTSVVSIERLNALDALGLLWRFPRIVGWEGKGQLAQQFHGLAQLVREVPVVAARIPWGPPFDPGIAGAVIEGVLSQPPPGAP